jgi:hypothetical protein
MAPPEGCPWKIGEATVTRDGAAQAYTSYDFSIGAFVSAVQFRDNYKCGDDGSCKKDGKIMLSIGLHPGTNHHADSGVIYAQALFPRLPKGAAKTRDVSVEWRLEKDHQGRKLISSGPARLILTSVMRGLDGSNSYGHLAGSLTATFCEAVDETLVPGGDCHELTVQFDSDVQHDSL